MLAWQVAFLIISRDPLRYRPLMPALFLEKLLYPSLCLPALRAGASAPAMLGGASLDVLWLVLFRHGVDQAAASFAVSFGGLEQFHYCCIPGLFEKLKQDPEPEGRFMRTTDGERPAYNVQLAVDAEHALIVAQQVTTESNDERSLLPMAEAAKHAVGNPASLNVALIRFRRRISK